MRWQLLRHASTLEWQKYTSYERPMRNLAYMLRFLPKFSGNWTDSVFLTDPDQPLEAERIFFPLQTKSFPAEKRNLQMSSISRAWVLVTFSPFIRAPELLRTTGPTKQSEIVIFDVKRPLLLDSRHPFSGSSILEIFTQEPRCRVSDGLDPTKFSHSET